MIYTFTKPRGLRSAGHAEVLQARVEKEVRARIIADLKFLKDCGIAEPKIQYKGNTEQIEVRFVEE